VPGREKSPGGGNRRGRLHVEIMLLPVGIVSLIGIPTSLVGKLTAVENFVAEIAANFQSGPPQTEGPEGARVGDPPGPLAAPSLAVEATADYDIRLVPPKLAAVLAGARIGEHLARHRNLRPLTQLLAPAEQLAGVDPGRTGDL
jgi:hypothetical protein